MGRTATGATASRARPAPRRTQRRRIGNAEVARVLREVGDLLEFEAASTYRIRAYRNAARAVEELPESVDAYLDGTAALTDIPGIGEDLAEKIASIARTGSVPLLRELRQRAPRGAVELMHVRGIGPKRARLLTEELGIHSVAGLVRAAKRGRIRALRGFGAKTEQAILREVAARGSEERRVLRATAAEYGEALLAYLRETTGVTHAELAGSFRRCRETVGDLDVLVATDDARRAVTRFLEYPELAEVLERGRTRAAIRLRSGLRVDLRVLAPESFGAALHYFTGSKAHNIAVRQMGRDRGLKLNEYGVFRGRRRIGGAEEQDVFDAIGLPWIPPELRENSGELEAAAAGTLPKLLTLDAIRGDLQCHTTDSDGRDSLDDMAAAAEAMGYEYLAITDHSPAVRVVGGMDAAGFRAQWKRIERLNRGLRSLTVLRGVEVDIHADGSLDLDDGVLAGFDLVLASVHSAFSASRDAQTKRLLRVIANPHVDILAHPMARQIGRRAPIDVDLDVVLAAAVEGGVWLEVNAQPERLDLDDAACRRASGLGAIFVVSTDAHSTAELGFMRWGVDQARRGWVARSHVANTWSLDRLLRNRRRVRG